MDDLTLLQQIGKMDPDRLRAYAQHLDFYNGLQWPGRARRSERRLTFNYAKAFIDKVTSYLMADLSFSIEPSDASHEAADRARQTEDALREVTEANNLLQLDFDTELDTAILGDGVYKVTWDAQEKRVRVSAPDVQGIFVWWVGDDVTRSWRLASKYQLSAEEVEMLFGVRDSAATLGGKRKKATIVEVWTSETLEIWIDNVLHEHRANPYGFIPFIVFPNLREPKKFWGISDIPSIEEPARELNRAFSQLSMILELSGNPVAVLENIDDAQGIAVQPGAVWELPESAKAYLLDLLQGGGVKLHADFINLVYRAVHDLSESPRTSFGDNRQGLSGVALEMEMNPLLQKIRRKRLIRSSVYQSRISMILNILEQKRNVSFHQVRPRIIWGPILPQDRSRLVQDEDVLVKAGIHSRRRAMGNLGIVDPETEMARVREEEGIST